MNILGLLLQGILSSKQGKNTFFHLLKKYKRYGVGCAGCATIILILLIILFTNIAIGIFNTLDGTSGMQDILQNFTVLYQENILLIQEWVAPILPLIQFFQ